MPLLKRKAFEKSAVSEYLRDDDEVFHCEITDEIFKDYEEYCERVILVNSMVWTCEMTGKNNLTYAEALESEKTARRSLKDFPMELRIPILYLATKTKRCSFAEMSEDVFNFVRERFFVGETVEACLEGDMWCEAHVLSVTAQKQRPDSKAMLPPTAYCYEVEQFAEDPMEAGQIGTAPHDRVRRRKGVYTRDKNRLFLKQFVAPGPVIGVKKSALDKYNIAKVNFDQIFTGSPPDFPSSKKLIKSSMSPPSTSKLPAKPGSATKLSLNKPSPDKKGRQESMDKFIKKTEKTEVKPKAPMDPAARKTQQDLVDKMRKAEELLRQRKEEEKLKKKEKNALVMAFMKEWQKVKDDQELEDHKMLPKGTVVEVDGISHKHFGDFLSVLEFVQNFSEILKVKDVFHNELDMETFRKSLTAKEHAWMFSELVQMMLATIFSLQEDEAEEYNEKKGIQESVENEQIEGPASTMRATELATKAGKWAQTYLGTSLSKLPLDPTTVSEVLRLHLLSSGGAAGARCAAWRHHQRGGYSSADDPALQLRASAPGVLRRLRTRHLADLPMDDKFLILQCLMNQILSYATVRDQIEEKIEEYKNLKQALRTLQISERKREPQLSAARVELKKETAQKKEELKLTGDKARQADEQLAEAIDKLKKESDAKRVENEKKNKELQAQLFDYTTYLGSDRAFRRYWLSRRVAGLFVEAGPEPRGPCRHKPLPPPPASNDDVVAYVTELYHAEKEQAGSDKENESAANSRSGSPKKPLAHLNGLAHKLNGVDSTTLHCRELLLCTADPDTCYVHGKGDYRPQWWVYNTEEQIVALIESLNKRGLRESELRQNLEQDRGNLVEYIKKCPLAYLTPGAAQSQPQIAPSTRRRIQPSLKVPPDCSLSEALELSLRDHILELEEKIFHGCLGAIKVKDREAWRGTIMLRGYDKQADYLSWGPAKQFRDDYHQPDGVLRLPHDIDKSEIESVPENKYRDPGHCLEAARRNGVKAEPEEAGAAPNVVRGLACALLQVAQAIHHKYLKRPLGLDEKERKDREARNKPLELEALERWEVSLLESRSWAALALHLLALDSSVSWAASVLNASCRVCRRRTDPDNMLLCDGCNKGHHLYCLKPQLTKVPEGDWFCDQCKPKEKTPRKKRKLYIDEQAEEDLDESSESFDAEAALSLCGACGSGGRLAAQCRACAARFHEECAAPRQRLSRRFLCDACSQPTRDSEDSEYNSTLVSLKGRKARGSKEPSPMLNGTANKGRKSKEVLNGSTTRRSKSLTNGVHEETRTGKKRGRREMAEEVLHTEALAQLLRDTMKHRDSWPFYEPVPLDQVPDYLEVIEQPMDLSTIKAKLESEQYDSDAALLADVALVFTNCYNYNKDTHPVAKAGLRLEKYVNKRCAELSLPALPASSTEEGAEEDDPPRKRAKHN
ncbi:bromodomain adjacent to zinc finger domain protein 1A isoform X2 [Bicyclus anynana]|uniref:Bromodomain adjacent to zinc finger domain protein 1A isoform X2 n=1 Tax=Bicyclus anynana TaxID=110368 RepID=A0A6J1NUG2_BICAN|nr:bromodomain adjacent to zinc finger domain protein 1A isoform X2 [Bicyclus anynana]